VAGISVGPYRVLEKLGAGGMGEVYLAHDPRLQRNVALKSVTGDWVRDSDAHHRLVREARAAGALNHPAIAAIYDIIEIDGRTYIVMEYVQGETLAALLRRGRLPLERVVEIGIQLADGLVAAHAAGIVHRDLKPSNVMVTADGRAKLLDFGVAKLMPAEEDTAETLTREERDSPQTAPGTVLGTIAYMAPEQLEGEPIDARADVFAFGAVLYEMLTGHRAFQGSSAASTAAAVISSEPLPPHHFVTGLPDELGRLVTRCLRKDRARRPQHMSDVRVALEEIRDEMDAPRVSVQASRPGSKGRMLRLSLGAAAIVTGFATWWLLAGRPPRVSNATTTQRLVSAFPGSHSAPSFSPDGRMIAFVSDASGSPQIWVKDLARGDPLQITHESSPAATPRWSGRGDQIVFALRDKGIWSVPPLGGASHRLVDDGTNPNLSGDGARLVFERGPEIWTAAADGSGARRIDGVPPRSFFSVSASPALSPDGRWIAYFQQMEGPNGDLAVIPLAGGTPRLLTHDLREAGSPVWTPDGSAILFWSKRAGSRTLWRVPVRGGSSMPVTTGAGEDADPAVTADGRRIIYTNQHNSSSLVVQDLRTGERREMLERRVIPWMPRGSPTDDRIAFFQEVGPDIHIFTVRADGTDLRQITFGAGEWDIHPSWSPDGQFIYYYRALPPPYSFRKIPAASGTSSEVVPGWRWERNMHGHVDPSGNAVVYLRQGDPEKPDATFVRDLSTGHESLLSEAGDMHLHKLEWSRDGSSILGSRHDGGVTLCPRSGGGCRVVAKGLAPVWSADGSRILFLRPGSSPDMRLLVSVDLDGGRETEHGEIGPLPPLGGAFDRLRDDRVVWTRFIKGRQELWLMDLRPS
jgi:eukaryotic-like serine/threonine-protein kinase